MPYKGYADVDDYNKAQREEVLTQELNQKDWEKKNGKQKPKSK